MLKKYTLQGQCHGSPTVVETKERGDEGGNINSFINPNTGVYTEQARLARRTRGRHSIPDAGQGQT